MRPSRRLSLILILTLLLTTLAAPSAVVAQEATPAGAGATMTAAQLGVPELALTLGADGFTVPTDVAAGRYLLTLTNQTEDLAYVMLLQPSDGWSLDETKTHIATMNSDSATPEDWAWIYEATFRGGGGTDGNGGVTQWIADLSPGRWVLATFDPSAQAVELPVTGTMPTDLPTPQTNATVIALTDEQFHQEDLLAEGGTPVPGSDLPPLEEIGEGPESGVVSAGQTIWWIVSFQRGYYTLACYVPDRDGTPHAFEGMLEHVEVQ